MNNKNDLDGMVVQIIFCVVFGIRDPVLKVATYSPFIASFGFLFEFANLGTIKVILY